MGLRGQGQDSSAQYTGSWSLIVVVVLYLLGKHHTETLGGTAGGMTQGFRFKGKILGDS